MYGYGHVASFGDISFAFTKLVIGLSLFVAALNNFPHGKHIGPTNFDVLIVSVTVPIAELSATEISSGTTPVQIL